MPGYECEELLALLWQIETYTVHEYIKRIVKKNKKFHVVNTEHEG